MINIAHYITHYTCSIWFASLRPKSKDSYVLVHGADNHIERVCTVITENDLKEAILAGHIYDEVVVTSMANQNADRTCRLAYIDAILPDPGQSLFDLFAYAGCGIILLSEMCRKWSGISYPRDTIALHANYSYA